MTGTQRLKRPHAANYLGISLSAFHRRCRDDDTFPKPVVCGPRLYFYSQADLDRWLALNSARANQAAPAHFHNHQGREMTAENAKQNPLDRYIRPSTRSKKVIGLLQKGDRWLDVSGLQRLLETDVDGVIIAGQFDNFPRSFKRKCDLQLPGRAPLTHAHFWRHSEIEKYLAEHGGLEAFKARQTAFRVRLQAAGIRRAERVARSREKAAIRRAEALAPASTPTTTE